MFLYSSRLTCEIFTRSLFSDLNVFPLGYLFVPNTRSPYLPNFSSNMPNLKTQNPNPFFSFSVSMSLFAIFAGPSIVSAWVLVYDHPNHLRTIIVIYLSNIRTVARVSQRRQTATFGTDLTIKPHSGTCLGAKCSPDIRGCWRPIWSSSTSARWELCRLPNRLLLPHQ